VRDGEKLIIWQQLLAQLHDVDAACDRLAHEVR
jgi:hypothetical protein